MASFNSGKHAFAREALTVTNSAVVSLTLGTYSNSTAPSHVSPNQYGNGQYRASAARVVVKAADINFTEEGTNPTTGAAGTGTPAGDRDAIYLESYEAIVKFKAIAQTAVNATLEVVYYR